MLNVSLISFVTWDDSIANNSILFRLNSNLFSIRSIALNLLNNTLYSMSKEKIGNTGVNRAATRQIMTG